MAGRSDSFRARQRLSGCRAALTKNGVAPAPELIVDGLVTSEQAQQPCPA
ncbi:hypothetical protein OVA06_09515 [Pseudarthrobacter sp. SL88]|nr:hypothetical protein [Pseudarthrobacter sp. SL88]MCY1674943.1 hypothetical protein [Pseudarthrobacter sp. SL88]